MLLAVDIGNTSTQIGVFEGEKLLTNWRAKTNKEATADQMALLMREFFQMAGFRFEEVKGVVISNVVPSQEHAITSMAKRYFKCEPLSVNYENIPIKIDYPNPKEIGADRLVNAYAAFKKFNTSTLVIDFGTATTFDYVDSSGAYAGGVIAPGIKISNEALYQWTSKLPRVDISKTENIIGKTTESAIKSGVYHGYVGLVKHTISKIKEEVNTPFRLLATGGLASLVTIDLDIEIDRFLTLNGLKLIYEQITSN